MKIDPTKLTWLLTTAINPALALLPAAMTSPQALVMLLAIAMQESRVAYRYQQVVGRPFEKGPARGFWQFEQGSEFSKGGVWGVVLHDASRYWLAKVCEARGVEFKAFAIWTAIENDDVLAAAVARLLLFTDRARLPSLDATHDESWECYRHNWRPGKPHRETWNDYHDLARETVATEAA